MNTEQDRIFQALKNNVEGRNEENGKTWGLVFLENVGQGREFAGHLSALSKASLYRKLDSEFGEVLLTSI